MRRLFLNPVSQTFALLIFMIASVLPVYSQEIKKLQIQPVQSTSEQTSEGLERKNVNSSEEAENSQLAESQRVATDQTTSQSYAFPTKRERFNRYVSNTVGPLSLLRTGLSAGVGQWRDNPEEWGQGMSGYGRRYASNFGQNLIQQSVTYGLDQTLGLDTGFEKSKRKGFFPRMKHALAENITSRTKTGKRVISVPRLAGVYASGVVAAETWYPSRFDYKDGLRIGTRSLVAGFGINLVREFLFSW